MLKAIKSQKQYRSALKRLCGLMNAAAGSPDAHELEVRAILIERYEREAFPINPPSPIDAIRFRMEQMGYSQADLARLLKSRSRASEVLAGSGRRLSLRTIRRLHQEWHIPADVLIRDAA
jgi:HTH-type transcriptional regulator / antitoxin HigA